MRNRIVVIAAALLIAMPVMAATGGPAPPFSLASRDGKDVEPDPVPGPGRDDQFLGQLVRTVPPGNAAAREHL